MIPFRSVSLRRLKGSLVAVGASIMLFAVLAWLWDLACPYRWPVTNEEFEQWLDKAVPVGSTKADVEAFLRSQQIVFDYGLPSGMTAGPRNMISAVTGTRGRWWGLHHEELPAFVDLYFIFDEKNILIQRTASSFHYSS